MAPGERVGIFADLLHPRPAARLAIVRSVTKVGESITFSAATVIAAVLTLLLASFSFYSDLGIPFAIAIGVILIAGLTLLPALLSIRLSLLAVKRTIFQAAFKRPKLLPWNIQGSGKAGVWSQVATRIVRRPGITLAIGIVVFGGLALGALGYVSGGFGGDTTPPAGSDSAAGTALLTKHFPQSSANPTVLLFKFSQPVWDDPSPLVKAAPATVGQRAVHPGRRAAERGRGAADPGPVHRAAQQARPGQGAAGRSQPPCAGVPPALYQAYRASGNLVSPDGRTVQFLTGLKAGNPGSTPALNAVPQVRTATAQGRAVHRRRR